MLKTDVRVPSPAQESQQISFTGRSDHASPHGKLIRAAVREVRTLTVLLPRRLFDNCLQESESIFVFISRLDIRIVLRTPSPQPVRLSVVFQTVHALGLVGIFVFSLARVRQPSRQAPSGPVRCGF